MASFALSARLQEHTWRYLLLIAPVLVVLAGSAGEEYDKFLQARHQVSQQAARAATAYASRVAARLDTQFIELQFIASALLGPEANPASPSKRAIDGLRRFMALHPDFYTFNIQSPDGNTILWSTTRQRHKTIEGSAFFVPLQRNPILLLGYPRYARRFNGYIFPMRFRVVDRTGKTRFFVGTPFRLDQLLKNPQPELPWAYTVIDKRTGAVIAAIHGQMVSYPRQLPPKQGARIGVPGYPLAVGESWAPSLAWDSYLQNAPSRWALQIGAVFLLAAAAWGILVLLRERDETARKHRRLAEYNALLAQVSQRLGRNADERSIILDICELALQHTGLAQALIVSPNADGAFTALAAMHRSGTVDKPPPDGEGAKELQESFRAVWKSGQPSYFQTACTGSASPGARAAIKSPRCAAASLPIHKEGRLWAILSLVHSQDASFDNDIRYLFEELALDISLWLDRIDLLQKQSLLANALGAVGDGVIIHDKNQRPTYANAAFYRMTGYTANEIRELGWEILQGEGTDPEVAAERTKALEEKKSFHGELIYYAKDRHQFWSLLTIDPVQGTAGETTHFVSVLRDITPLRKLSARLEFQALHDVLTELPNRRALDRHLPRAITRASRAGNAMAVGIIDLDDFKPINDTWGHEAGDALLQDLSKRLKSALRESDMLARLGGDEFVVVFEDLDERHAITQLTTVLNRLHEAVETPFDIQNGIQARVEMTMGLALFPVDANDPDALLRHADAAMYNAKLHKHDRKQWWQFGSASGNLPEREAPFDVYGNEAAALLEKIQPSLDMVIGRFVGDFYGEVKADPQANRLLTSLAKGEMYLLEKKQADYLRFIFDVDTTKSMIMRRARHLGHVHTLVGLNFALLVNFMARYRRLLSEQINQLVLSSRERYRIMLICDARLQDDLQVEMQESDRIVDKYLQILSEPLPPEGTLWQDSARNELDTLCKLPGILSAEILRPDQQGIFQVEVSHFHVERISSRVTHDAEGSQEAILPDSSHQKLIAEAWNSSSTQQTGSLSLSGSWGPLPGEGVRSMLAIPVLDTLGHTAFVLAIHGAYPNQFESGWMRQFTRGLQQRWGQLHQRATGASARSVLSQQTARQYRERLFRGGLRMFMQPIIGLRTGRIAKVEALARLQCDDGKLVMPSEFLPLLGDAELDRLFRLGLNIVLKQLVLWDSEGFIVDATVNLPPSSLLDPYCPHWMEEALEKHGVAPNRLTLELLEGQRVDHPLQDAAIVRLQKLGVGLSLDDLGSGYSSLTRLAKLPFKIIKVDQDLLLHIREDPIHTLGLVRAIVQMGIDFDHEVVVEGLDGLDVIEAARILGAPLGQGYGLAEPMAAGQIIPWSKSFRFDVEPDRIHTFLGALAHHWLGVHRIRMGLAESPKGLEQCPITRFLEERGLQHSEAASWHAKIHDNIDLRENSDRFMEWLIARIREDT